MFRCISVALVCAAALSLTLTAQAAPSARRVTLEEAVARALNAAPALKAREELVTAAQAQIAQSGALPNPTLDAELENVGGGGGFEGFEQSELTVGVSQRFERGGKRQSRVALAEAERDVATLERERTRATVAFEARKAFIDLFAAEAARDNATARLKAAREIQAMATRRVAAARDPLTVKLRAEIQTAEARTAHDQADREAKSAKRALALLWGDPAASFEIDARTLRRPPSQHAHDTQAAPDLRAGEIAARRAARKLDLERANASSDVSLGVGIRRFEEGGDIAGVLSLSVPIAVFDDNQGNIDRAAAEQRAAELDAADARRRYAASLITLEDEETRARSELEAIQKELLPRAKRALAEARRGYNAGAFTYQEVAEAQRILGELDTREITALRALHLADANLDRIAGRTFLENAQ
jgi:cobalt-zinc-cadmium efflux system outer membrane protein